MAHFAELDSKNIVKQVIVIDNRVLLNSDGDEVEQLGIDYCKSLFGEKTNWKQTSYNARIRKIYAGIGCSYDEEKDAFVPPQPFSSWTFNEESWRWEAPSPRPELKEGELGFYGWDEESTSWVFNEIIIPETTVEE